MGRGNVNVSKNDGLYYVSYDDIYVYSNNADPDDVIFQRDIFKFNNAGVYEFDETLSQDNYNEMLDTIRTKFAAKFKSFIPIDYTTSSTPKYTSKHVILKNKMFCIAVEDNEWSVAIELIANDGFEAPGLRQQHFNTYYKGLREILLEMFDEIYIRTGSWTSGKITKDEPPDIDDTVAACKVKLDKKAKATSKYQPPVKERKKVIKNDRTNA